MKIGYFPGCSLHATANEFDSSLRAVMGPLGVQLQEVQDWACCGASSAHATHHLLSVALPARTLAKAEAQQFTELLAPCASCYSRLASARQQLRQSPELTQKVHKVLGKSFENRVEVLSLTQLLSRLLPQIGAAVKRPLTGLRVACYYGCLLLRPGHLNPEQDPEAPRGLEQLIEKLGATAVSWNHRSECCGAGFSLARTPSVLRLGRAILQDAKDQGAHAIAVACPMCHSNLDLRQKAMASATEPPFRMPIVYLPQLMGLALGLSPQPLGLDRHFVSTEPLLQSIAQLAKPVAALPAKEA